MLKKLTPILVLCMGIANWAHAQNKDSLGITKLDAIAFFEQVRDTAAIQLVDVRTPEEFAHGHVKGALNMNVNAEDFDKQILKLDPEVPVYLYCRSGVRSAKAAEHLRQRGFSQLFEMKGGIKQWRSDKLPEVVEQRKESF